MRFKKLLVILLILLVVLVVGCKRKSTTISAEEVTEELETPDTSLENTDNQEDKNNESDTQDQTAADIIKNGQDIEGTGQTQDHEPNMEWANIDPDYVRPTPVQWQVKTNYTGSGKGYRRLISDQIKEGLVEIPDCEYCSND